MRRETLRRSFVITIVTVTLAALTPAGTCLAGETDATSTAGASQPAANSARVLIAYYSRRGNTEKMARGAAEGARRVKGVLVTIKQVTEVTKEDLEKADGLILGSPTYYANIPGAMKIAIDDWAWKMKVDFTDKIGGALATGGGQVGGKEHVVQSLVMFMLSNRMLVAGPLYQGRDAQDIWGEPGSAAMTGPLDPGVSDAELDSARRLGERIATLAWRLKGAK